MIELDYKIFHYIIYTNKKLCKINIIDSEMCLFCNNCIEYLVHMFLKCERLKSFIAFILYHIENLLCLMPNNYINALNFDMLIFWGYHEKPQNVNYTLINIILSQARLSMSKTRNVLAQTGKQMNITRFFKYSFEKYVSYFYHYYSSSMKDSLFQKYFINFNKIVSVENNKLMFKW